MSSIVAKENAKKSIALLLEELNNSSFKDRYKLSSKVEREWSILTAGECVPERKVKCEIQPSSDPKDDEELKSIQEKIKDIATADEKTYDILKEISLSFKITVGDVLPDYTEGFTNVFS